MMKIGPVRVLFENDCDQYGVVWRMSVFIAIARQLDG
jgi:hypothetical protein